MKTLLLLLLGFVLLPQQMISAQTPRAQFVHNAADPVLDTVDVYIDSVLTLDDFAFQTATPFMDVPVGTHSWAIAPKASTAVGDSLVSGTLLFEDGQLYHVIAAGVLDETAFKPNPDGRDIRAKLFVGADARTGTSDPANFATRQFWGVTDMPRSHFYDFNDLRFGGLNYGDFTEWAGTTASLRTGSIRVAGLATSDLLVTEGDFRDRAGVASLSLVSGFFVGEDGLGFDLFTVLNDGSVLKPANLTANMRAQIVHASPDPEVDTVDVYLDGGLLIEDLPYQGARPFMTLPTGTHNLDFVPSSKTDGLAALQSRQSYEEDKTYTMVLAGVVKPEDWPANPDGRDVSLNLFGAEDAVEASTQTGEWMLRGFVAVPDMGLIDYWVDTWKMTILESAGFGDFSPYGHDTDASQLVGSLRPAGSGLSDPALFSAQGSWGDLPGDAFLEVITGTVRDSIESFYVPADGNVGKFKVVTDVDEAAPEVPSDFAVHGNYPNPFNPSTSITFDLPDAASVSVEVFDATGRMVAKTQEATYSAGARHAVHVDATAWGSGLYLYKDNAQGRTSSWIGSGRMILVK